MFWFLPLINEHMEEGSCDFGLVNSYKNSKTNNTNEEHVYLLKDNKVLKLYITIDENLIEQSFKLLKDNLTKKDFIYVNDNDFASYHFPLAYYEFNHNNVFKQNKYKIPNKNRLNSTLLYILIDIYNKFQINSDILNDLNEEYKFRYHERNNIDEIDRIWIECIQNIVNNLEIKIIEEYDYNVFEQSITFLEDIGKKELISMIDVLLELKQILKSAKENKEIFDNLKININKEKQKRK